VLESQAAEVESNLALIDQITKVAVDLAVERPRLRAELDDLEEKCAANEVSDFTLSKLDIPQVSEMSMVRLMDVDEQGTPIGLDEFGSNKLDIQDVSERIPVLSLPRQLGDRRSDCLRSSFKVFLCFCFGLSA